MWIIYANPVDAAEAAARITRRYLRLRAQSATDGLLVDMAAEALVAEAGVADEALGPFAYTLPGRRAGALVTDGQTERWALPAETAGGQWALPLPDGWAPGDVPGLPAGFTAQADAPAWPQGDPL